MRCRVSDLVFCLTFASPGLSSVVAAQAGPRLNFVPGITYTMRVTGGAARSTAAAGAGAPGAQNYVGHAIFAVNRGRVDIVDGGVDPLFAKGDYILFDATDIVVVHPARQEFIEVSSDGANTAMQRLASAGITMTLSDEKVTIDSLGPGDTIAGVATRRYRMTMAFNMAMDAGVMQQRLGTESVTEYWVGIVPGMTANPMLRSNGLSGRSGPGSMFKTLSARVDSVSARMGGTIALRTRAATKLITGPGQIVETQQGSEVSELQHRDVDESLLVLPAGFKAVRLPGVEDVPPPANAGAKWRVLPRPLR